MAISGALTGWGRMTCIVLAALLAVMSGGEVRAQESAPRGDGYKFGSLLKVAGYGLGDNYFVIGNELPDILFEEEQFPFPLLSFAGRTLPPQRIIGTVQRRNVAYGEGARRAFDEPTADDLHLVDDDPVDLALRFHFTGEQELFRIEATVIQTEVDCQRVLLSMTAQMGKPDARLITSAIWRLVDIDRQEVLDVTCQPGQGYQADLSDVSISERFDARGQEQFIEIWRRYRRARRR